MALQCCKTTSHKVFSGLLSCLRSSDFLPVYGITVVLLLLIFPPLCLKMHHSIYFRTSNTKEQRIELSKIANGEQKKAALKYLENFMKTNSPAFPIKTNLDVTIGIVTINRNTPYYKPGYFVQSLSKILQILNEFHRKNRRWKFGLVICNVDKDPMKHQEAVKYSTHLTHFMKYLNKSVPSVDIFEKEKLDYIYCINETLSYSPKYGTVIVEDDALANDNFFDVLTEFLSNRVNMYIESDRLAYLKLYHPLRLMGYVSLEKDRIPELLGLGAVFGTMALAVQYYIYGKYKRQLKFLYTTWLLWTIAMMVFAAAIGKQNLQKFRELSPFFYQLVPSPECCTQAMFFTKKGGLDLVNYLSKVECTAGDPKDLTMARFVSEKSKTAKMISPGLFTHIGLYSSLREMFVDPHILP